ncbi:hypothetical protein ACFVRU_14560 [Streptomyces sp. NPDC057927]
MVPGAFTRSVGMRLAIVATAHLQARDLDHGLELGNRSVDILTRVQSSRAMDYVAEFNTTLAPLAARASRPRIHPPYPHRTRRRRLKRRRGPAAHRDSTTRRPGSTGSAGFAPWAPFCPPARGARPRPRLLPAHRAG